jgi:hypothetical protein
MREEAISNRLEFVLFSFREVIIASPAHLEAMKMDGLVPRLKRRLGSGAAEARLKVCDAGGAFLGASECCLRARTQAAPEQVHNNL